MMILYKITVRSEDRQPMFLNVGAKNAVEAATLAQARFALLNAGAGCRVTELKEDGALVI